MRKIILLVTFLPLIVLSQDADQNEDTYLCITDKATGFRLENRNWMETTFRVDDVRYLLRPIKNTDLQFDDAHVYSWASFGDEFGLASCSAPNDYGFVFCRGVAGDIRINVNNGHFILYYPGGYLSYDEDDDTADTTSVEIGKCAKL